MSKRSKSDVPTSTPKRPCTAQATLMKYFKESEQQDGASSSSRKVIATTPESYGLKVYSKSEIESASGLKQEYLKFWNDKAAELCEDKSVRAKLSTNKKRIMGAINTSWTLQRTEILQIHAEEVIEAAKRVYADEVKREVILSSIRSNVARMQDAASSVNQLYHIMDLSTPAEILKMEVDLAQEITTLKRAQDALIKALQRKREDILVSGQDEYELMTCDSPANISQADIDELAEIVKKETQDTNFEPTTDVEVPSVDD